MTNFLQVIQKLIERVNPERLPFLETYKHCTFELASHPYGCRVLQRCFEYLSGAARSPLLEELVRYTSELATDQFGVGYSFVRSFDAKLSFIELRYPICFGKWRTYRTRCHNQPDEGTDNGSFKAQVCVECGRESFNQSEPRGSA